MFFPVHFYGDQLPSRQAIVECAEMTDSVRLVLANRFTSRLRGLIGLSPIPQSIWLWIEPCQSIHTFFIKEPISLVYLNRLDEVCKLVSDVHPSRINCCLSASSVLETKRKSLKDIESIIPMIQEKIRMVRMTQKR